MRRCFMTGNISDFLRCGIAAARSFLFGQILSNAPNPLPGIALQRQNFPQKKKYAVVIAYKVCYNDKKYREFQKRYLAGCFAIQR